MRQIDIHFADYICQVQDSSSSENLWLLAALVSYFANEGDSAFSIERVRGRTLKDIFDTKDTDNFEDNAPFDEKMTTLEEAELLKNDLAIGEPGELKPIIFDGVLFYLNRFNQYEETVADFIKNHARNHDDVTCMEKEINELFKNNYIENTDHINWQKIAAIMALRSGFSIISGGPGTGKTHTVGKILTLLIEKNPETRIKMVAPTGKAADRLNESIKKFKNNEKKNAKQEEREEINSDVLDKIPESAETIHKFIGINSYKLKYDKYSPAPIDVLVIDEASMVSLPLFAKTFEAISKECRVILLGDKDQLMAVENGNVLKDMTDSETLNSFSSDFVHCVAKLTNNELKLPITATPTLMEDAAIQLEHSYRFDEKSGIGHLSNAVNLADENTTQEELLALFDKYPDIEILHESTKEDIKKYIRLFCKEHLKEYKKALDAGDVRGIMASLAKFRILCAVNDGPFGVNEINELIEQTLLKKKSADSFYHGRPVLITTNDYKLGLMNGDIGIIIEDGDKELKAYFPGSDDTFREFNPASLGDHKTAFTISIHKSQGSEYENVFIILPPEENKILTKELIYTAITRASGKCTVISSHKIFHKAAITKMRRQSGLKSKIT